MPWLLHKLHTLSVNTQGLWPLAVSHLLADADVDPRRPHSALLLHCTLEVLPGARAPSLSLLHHCPARTSPRIFHWHSTRCRPLVSSALLLPRLQSLSLAWPLHCASDKPHKAVLDLDFVPAFMVHRAFTILPTSVLHASHASPSHPLSLLSELRLPAPPTPALALFLQSFRLLIWGCIPLISHHSFLPPLPLHTQGSPGQDPVAFATL
ncbi:hypothetical protein B0H13DRAFT_2370071 [Mycena leptocephala]|nr:hypothetical protein B0H13DRAFT_2370071 [Mycena leptocephala]